MKEATVPKMPPTSNDPTASGIGVFKYEVNDIHTAATPIDNTAAQSSNNTTFTVGSWPRNTYCKKEILDSLEHFFILLIATANVAPSDINEPPSTKYAQNRESNGSAWISPVTPW